MRELANHWIQGADFSSTHYGAADQSTVLDLFRGYPWQKELQLFTERETRDEESCPPGLGLNATNQDILHLCAVGAGEWMVHFHRSESHESFGLSRSERDRVETYEGVTTRQAEQMIAQFFLGEQLNPV